MITGVGLLGPELDALIGRLDIAIGILTEEEHALHQRFGGPSDGTQIHAPSFRGLGDEPERFSVDSAWMPRLVLIAKSTYVWLDQLSRQFGRDIRTLDAVDEALDTLASWGMTGLWLIGLWQRSAASERIKRMRGNAEAVASAYSLDDYRIAEDLGGEAPTPTCATEPGRAASDSPATWCPITWASTRAGSSTTPSGSCRFRGRPIRRTASRAPTWRRTSRPGSSSRTTTGTTATRRSSSSASTERAARSASSTTATTARASRGTTPPSSTSSSPRSASRSIRTIVDVARRFPVIRFDAAMVLAKRHVRRLWWPEPGAGDGIPSRAEHAMSQAEFDARMPVEFWREVVDRVAAEVPDTLLLAEAFWMLEGYFVRTLGMHRVYNSAFMHMLRDENGAGYRKLMRDTLEFDPEILKRYVNFMSNPDEKTAVEQFGKGDKYFGVATVMATMPGLPMPVTGRSKASARSTGWSSDGRPSPSRRSVAARAPRARDLPAAPPAGLVRRGP